MKLIPNFWITNLSQKIIFIAYLLLAITLKLTHEPWRDEAEPWLILRDASLWQLFYRAGNDGHPLLWHLIQLPFVQLGFPYQSLPWIHLFFVIIFAWLVIFKSPFPLWFKILTLFGYYFSYEFLAISRYYIIHALLLFAVANYYKERETRPVLFGSLLLLLANCSAFGFLTSGIINLFIFFQLYQATNKQPSKTIFVITTIGLILALAQLWPRANGFTPGIILSLFRPEQYLNSIHLSLMPNNPARIFPIIVFHLGLLYFLLAFTKFKTQSLIALLTIASIFYVIIFKGYYFTLRHYGILYSGLLFGLWLVPNQRGYKVILALIGICLILSLPVSYHAWKYDYLYAYSSASEMGKFLSNPKYESAQLIGFPHAQSAAVLPYLKDKKFYYPNLDQVGSYMSWDQNFLAGFKVDPPEVLRRIKKQFAKWRSRAF